MIIQAQCHKVQVSPVLKAPDLKWLYRPFGVRLPPLGEPRKVEQPSKSTNRKLIRSKYATQIVEVLVPDGTEYMQVEAVEIQRSFPLCH